MTPDQQIAFLLFGAFIAATGWLIIHCVAAGRREDRDGADETERVLAWLESLRNTDVPTLHNAEAVALGNDSGLRVPNQREAS